MNKILKIAQIFLFIAIPAYTLPNTFLNHEELRKSLDYHVLNEDGSLKDPSIKIIESIPEGKRYGVCHNHAIEKTLNGERFNIQGTRDWHEDLNFLDYCEKVSESDKKPGDIAAYKLHVKSSVILHTGLVCGDNCVESKWGIRPLILQHPTMTVPIGYGNHVEYYRLVNPKEEVIEDLKRKIAMNDSMKRLCAQWNRELVFHTDISNPDHVKVILETIMCADVNALNSKAQTLLMIAARNDDLNSAKMLITYGADLNKEDIAGNTAWSFATENGSAAMLQALQQTDHNLKLKSDASRVLSDVYIWSVS